MKTRLSPASLRMTIPLLIIVFSVGLATLGWGTGDKQTAHIACHALSHARSAAAKPPRTMPVRQVVQRSAGTVSNGNPAQNSLTPNLLNLTQSVTSVTSKMPAWSPLAGGEFAFLSNGKDATGAGTLNALDSATSFSLYTMNSDGSDLYRYDLLQPIGSVNGLAWRPTMPRRFMSASAGGVPGIIAILSTPSIPPPAALPSAEFAGEWDNLPIERRDRRTDRVPGQCHHLLRNAGGPERLAGHRIGTFTASPLPAASCSS